MPIIRLVLVLAIAGGLFLFARFNWVPTQLTFLGVQTPALPLALWILGAIAAGVLTTLLIQGLIGLSNYMAARRVRAQFRQSARRSGFQGRSTTASSSAYSATANDDAAWQNWEGYEDTGRTTSSTDRSTSREPIDDWDVEPSDDWEDDTPIDTPMERPRATVRDRTEYEKPQEPKTASRSGSVYSYGYREPGNSGVGKAEPVVDRPVVDADYRVIVPPYRSLDDEPPASENADDWFEDDDSNDRR